MKKQQVLSMILLGVLFYSFICIQSPVFTSNKKPEVKSTEENKTVEDKETKSEVESTTIPQYAANYVPAAKYPWWDPLYSYRIPLEINSSYIDRIDYSVNIPINFTQQLELLNWSGQFDPNSVRVVEYNSTYNPIIVNSELSGTNIYVVPSNFIPKSKYSNYDTHTNAYGFLRFAIPGNASVNSNRTFMVYFDIVENNGVHSLPDEIKWNADYNYQNDLIGDHKFHLAYGSYQDYGGLYGDITIWNANMTNVMYDTSMGGLRNYFDFVVGDFDGNGQKEIVASDRANLFTVMQYNQQSGQFETEFLGDYNFETLLDTNVSNSYDWTNYEIVAADIDNDNCDEIITIQYNNGGTNNDYIIIYNFTRYWNGLYKLNVQQAISSNINPLEFALADLNKDGYLDIISGTYGNANPSYYLNVNLNNKGVFSNTPNASSTSANSQLHSIRCADIDYDGKIEICATYFYNRYLWIWEWGTTLTFERRWGLLTGFLPDNAVIGGIDDWDRDGIMEIAFGNLDTGAPYSGVQVYEVRGHNDLITTAEWTNTSFTYQRILYPRFGDVDNDGTVELSAGSYRTFSTPYLPRVHVFNSSSTTYEYQTDPKDGTTLGVGELYGSNLMVMGAWDNLVYRQEPTYFVHAGHVKEADLVVQVLDVDMAPVPGVEVKVTNGSTFTSIANTSAFGEVRFNYLENGNYDVKLNLTSDLSELEITSTAVNINNTRCLVERLNMTTQIWQIAFDVKDVDGNAMPRARMEMWNSTWGVDLISNISSVDGWQTGEKFIWLNRTDVTNEYNYTVKYVRSLYNPTNVVLGTGSVIQQGANINSSYFNLTSRQSYGGNNYAHIFTYYAQGSSEYEYGNQRLNWANISISNIAEYLYQIELTLLQADGFRESLGTYEILGTSTTSWNKEVPLWNALEKGYGIEIKVYTHNTTDNNGIINVTLEEECTKTINVNLARINMFFSDTSNVTAPGLKIKVFNTYNDRITNNPLVNLTTNENGEALDSSGLPFLYVVRSAAVENYSITVDFVGSKSFSNASLTSLIFETYFNFSIATQISMSFVVSLDMSKFKTYIKVINTPVTVVPFLGGLYLKVNVTAEANDSESIPPFYFNSSITPDDIIFNIYNIQDSRLIKSVVPICNGTIGIYEYTIHPETDQISLEPGNYGFSVQMIAHTSGYGSDPIPVTFNFQVTPISDSLTARLGVSTQDTSILDIYWGKSINVSAYFFDLEHLIPISGAAITYRAPWSFVENPIDELSGYPGYYQFQLNTTDAGNVGTYVLEFFAQQTNYTSKSNIKLTVNIKPLETQLNGSAPTDILFVSDPIRVYKTKAVNISLVFWNYIDDVGLSGAVVKHYNCKYTAADGTTNSTFEADLIDVGVGIYILDIDTETREVGTYSFEILMTKPNHVSKVASINIEIVSLPIKYDIGKNLDGGILKFAEKQGTSIPLRLLLKDTVNDVDLKGATVIMIINNVTYTFKDNEDGTYTLDFNTNDYNAFYNQQSLTGQLIISKGNYSTITIPVQITVEMPEIFPGIPTFYFAIVMGAVALLVGSVVVNKAITNARIPAFVKLINKTEKLIAGKKEVPTDRITTNMNEDIVERFGKEWQMLDLNLSSILGITKAEDKNATPADKQGGNK